MRPASRWLGVLLGLVAVCANAKGGGPLPGLTPAEAEQFKVGFAAFRRHLFPPEGLGPGFNQARCYGCHSNPALGGRSKRQRSIVTRFGTTTGGVFDPMTAHGGSLLQNNAIFPECLETVPPQATIVIQRMTSSAFGAGLIEAIPAQQIIDRAAAQAIANPAMAGRVHWLASPSDNVVRVGRFGRKAQWPLIVDAVGDALVNEMGITNAVFPSENAPNGNLATLAQCDTVADPEDTHDLLGTLTALLRFLGPPYEGPPNPVVAQGEALFNQIGCAFCHYPGYTTVSAVGALNGKSAPILSDLLLHDIGTGDGIVQGDAQGNEFRTQPIWLAGQGPYLHDGRAQSLTDAIDLHHGQAQPTRDAFFALTLLEQAAVLKYLK